MNHPSGVRVKMDLAMYDTFVCKRCKKDYVFLLPKKAVPCPQHSENICCSCCMRTGESAYCVGKTTSYVVPR